MQLLKKEREALAALLEQGAETPDELAKIVAGKLDEMRASRTTYTVVLRFGIGIHQHHMCFGPYSTRAQAEKAFDKHLVHTQPSAWAFVPTRTAEGIEEMIAEADKTPELKGDWAIVKADGRAYRKGWDGKQKTRSQYVDA